MPLQTPNRVSSSNSLAKSKRRRRRSVLAEHVFNIRNSLASSSANIIGVVILRTHTHTPLVTTSSSSHFSANSCNFFFCFALFLSHQLTSTHPANGHGVLQFEHQPCITVAESIGWCEGFEDQVRRGFLSSFPPFRAFWLRSLRVLFGLAGSFQEH